MTRTLRIALLAAAMVAVILTMVALYARDLHGGSEITLKTEPVDPRSLFLGHYATLGYEASRLGADLVAGHCYEKDAAVFVTFEPDADGHWRAVRAAPTMPEDGFGDMRATLRGRAGWGGCEPEVPAFPDELVFITYGIEQYFASPETAKRLETLARRRPSVDGEPEPEPLLIILSVPKSGRALIKGVVIDGIKTYDQTIW